MVTCTGTGANGDHCCYINGKVCPLLVEVAGIPRCSVWGQWDSGPWRNSAAAEWFDRMYPGYNCSDWPQNIPNATGGLCCWEGVL